MHFTAEELERRKAAKAERVSQIIGRQRKPFGLGDAVASVAQPIARAIDRVAGTKIAECGGCKKRRAALNKLVPNL